MATPQPGYTKAGMGGIGAGGALNRHSAAGRTGAAREKTAHHNPPGWAIELAEALARYLAKVA